MNPSHPFSSSPQHPSSSSQEDDDDLIATIQSQQQALLSTYANNNAAMAYFLEIMSTQAINPSHGGSISGHRVIHRDREDGDRRLHADYFSENPKYNEAIFRRRFRMSRNLFLRIANAVAEHDNYFVQRRDTIGRLGLSTLQKVTAAFRILAYGVAADATDEYIQIGESTAIESLKRFCRAVVEVFGQCYLRAPDANDVARLLEIGERRGFPANGTAPPAHYVIQGKVYDTGYYLADGIYPKWSTLVQTIHQPLGPKKKLFAMMQEACRKDVERAFGVLQSRFAIVKGPVRFWDKHVLHDIMTSCIIMHNMIIEDERDEQVDIQSGREAPAPEVDICRDERIVFEEFLARHRQIKNKEAHYALRDALIEHMWEHYGNSNN
ncbi:PREDICTED: uncharacterized protein LOC109172944 [Ipomoea nil]|uniref:uncharacterized protein LOC109172944 n=1 Tax=Ipomoea nil TaxID=35883 RepID=UPI000901C986|nr:PREDICTED: uncharacterized protein LOC109172944 [Ipomoea nil]